METSGLRLVALCGSIPHWHTGQHIHGRNRKAGPAACGIHSNTRTLALAPALGCNPVLSRQILRSKGLTDCLSVNQQLRRAKTDGWQHGRPTHHSTRRAQEAAQAGEVKRRTSWRTRLCACGHFILVTWILVAWWRSGARRFWRKPFSVGRRADIPVIRNYVVSLTRHHPWRRSQHICTLSNRKPPRGAIALTRRRLSPTEARYPSWPRADSLTTSGSTSPRSYAFVILHGLNNSPRYPGPNHIRCFRLSQARLPSGRSPDRRDKWLDRTASVRGGS